MHRVLKDSDLETWWRDNWHYGVDDLIIYYEKKLKKLVGDGMVAPAMTEEAREEYSRDGCWVFGRVRTYDIFATQEKLEYLKDNYDYLKREDDDDR